MSEEKKKGQVAWIVPDAVMTVIRANLGAQPHDQVRPILDVLEQCQSLSDEWLQAQGYVKVEIPNRKGRRAARKNAGKDSKKPGKLVPIDGEGEASAS
jgi:hypothetical protein